MAAALFAAACGGEPPKAEAPAPPPPKPKTVQEKVARYQECWRYVNTKAWDPFRGCLADNMTSEAMGSGRPAMTSADQVVADLKSFRESFSDIDGTLQIILTKDDTVVSLAQLNGTNDGPMPGPGGKPMQPTKKAVGYLLGHVIHFDAMGDKATREEEYSDTPTMLAQLGVSKAPARPVMPKSTAKPVVVIASGSETEQKNADTFKAQLEVFNKHDLKAIEGFNAPGAVFRDMSAPKDTDAKGNLVALNAFIRAFPDCKLVTTSVWGAGDYVVAQGTFEGTNKGAAPAMGIRKATGKTVKLPFLEITKFENGKIKEDTVVYDSMAMAQQLGLMPSAAPTN